MWVWVGLFSAIAILTVAMAILTIFDDPEARD